MAFTWGPHDSDSFYKSLKTAYKEVVHWKLNCFKVPLVKVGKSFVSEMARVYDAFATGSALESIALMAATILPHLTEGRKRKNTLLALEEGWRMGTFRSW